MNLLEYNILPWLKSLELKPGQFKICKHGASGGLGTSCLALKIAYTINELNQFETERWGDFIKSFQAENGDFVDKNLLGRKFGPLFIPFLKNPDVRRAETRQSCASLMCIGEKTYYPIKNIVTYDKAKKYFHSFNWNRPWHAGSHFSHLIFLLRYNLNNFGYYYGDLNYHVIVPILWGELDKILDHKTGCWFKGNCPDFQKINGAMKILTAYSIARLPPELPETLIDFCLKVNHRNDGCHILDILYVIHYCAKFTNHKRDKVKKFAEQKLIEIQKFRKKDGAFSFYPDKSQTHYYGRRISKGLCESDIHGTHLFTWALCLIAEILEDFNEISWNLPVT